MPFPDPSLTPLIGLAAMAAGVLRFHMRDMRGMLGASAVSNLLFGLELLLLGNIPGAASCAASALRSLIFATPFGRAHKAALLPFIAAAMLAAGLLAAPLSWQSFAVALSLVTLYAEARGNASFYRAASLFVCPFWAVYAVCAGSPGLAAFSLLGMASCALSLRRARLPARPSAPASRSPAAAPAE